MRTPAPAATATSVRLPPPARGLGERLVGLAAAGAAIVALGGCRSVAEAPGAAASVVVSEERSLPFLLGGIQVDEPDDEAWVESLAEAGFNAVAVTAYARHGDWDSDDLRFGGVSGALVAEVRAAKARGLHVVLILRVALDHAFPRNRFLWHGMILPATDELLRSWFRKYARFAVRWARIARAEGIDVLGIASELNALTSTVPVDAIPELEAWYMNEEQQWHRAQQIEALAPDIDPRHLRGSWGETYDSLPRYLGDRLTTHRKWALQVTGLDGEATSEDEAIRFLNRRRAKLRDEWEGLIAAVRREYDGRLTYAANFDQYQAVSFWPQLDLLGINAYFPLRRAGIATSPPAVSTAPLQAAWERILRRVDVVRQEAGVPEMPVLFTELGYTSRRDSTVEPWAADGFSLVSDSEDSQVLVWEERPTSRQERAAAVAALRRAARSSAPGLLRGILWWKLSTRRQHEAIEPFVLVLERDPADPVLRELQAFLSGRSFAR